MISILAMLLTANSFPPCNGSFINEVWKAQDSTYWYCNGATWDAITASPDGGTIDHLYIPGTLGVDGGVVFASTLGVIGNITGADAGLSNNFYAGGSVGAGSAITANLTGSIGAGSAAFAANQGLVQMSTASLGFYGNNGATFGTTGASTSTLQGVFATIPQVGFDTTRGVWAENSGDGGWQAICTQTNNYCAPFPDAGFLNVAANDGGFQRVAASQDVQVAGQLVPTQHGTTQLAIECGMDAGTSGVLTWAFGTAFGAAPVCVCSHVDTTNANACTIDHTVVPTTALARFNVASGGTDKISFCCAGTK